MFAKRAEKRETRQRLKTGEREFVEAIQKNNCMYNHGTIADFFGPFRSIAAKGHEESRWALDVADSTNRPEDMIDAFIKTNCGMGFFWAACLALQFSWVRSMELAKRSCDAGCSWGMVFYVQDSDQRTELLEKACLQNNPIALFFAGMEHECLLNMDKAYICYKRAAELGCDIACQKMAELCRCNKEIVQAIRWASQSWSQFDVVFGYGIFWTLYEQSSNDNANDCEIMEVGKALYWNAHGVKDEQPKHLCDVFYNPCIDYYCSCMDLQQESLLVFLLCWNNLTGVKDMGRCIAKIVWEQRYECLITKFKTH